MHAHSHSEMRCIVALFSSLKYPVHIAMVRCAALFDLHKGMSTVWVAEGGRLQQTQSLVCCTSLPGCRARSVQPKGLLCMRLGSNLRLRLLRQAVHVQWKIAPALAAGCTVVSKPSEMTSLTCLEMAAIMEEVGLPPGVFNLVTGTGPDAGAPLV